MPETPYQLLTVDVWDTLLRRRVHPDLIKMHTARYMYFYLHHALKPEFRDVEKLFHLRRDAEWKIGQRRASAELPPRSGHTAPGDPADDEYEAEEVLHHLLGDILQSPEEDHAPMVESIIRAEIEQEIRLSYPDSRIMGELAHIPADTVLVLSDFYYNKDRLQQILHAKLPDFTPQDVLVSADMGLNKRSGRAFAHVQQQQGVTPERHVHIGDNLHSDVRMARQSGAGAVHFYHPEEESHRARHQKAFDRWMHERSIDHYVAQLEQTLQSLPAPEGYSPEQKELFRAGKEYGIVYTFFVLSVIEDALREGFDTVYYFTREGEFFARIHRALKAENPYGGTFPKADILEVSRLATFFPSLREITLPEMMRVWNMYSCQSMRAFFRTLDIDIDPYMPLLERHDLVRNLEEKITYPWQDARVQALFADAQFQEKITAEHAERREAALSYLNKKGIQENDRALICDIGWRGTIQDNLAFLLPGTYFRGHYMELDRLLNDQPENTTKHAFYLDARFHPEKTSGLPRSVSVLEMLSNVPGGSTRRYVQKGNTVETIKEPSPQEDAVHEHFVQYFQEGVLAAAPMVGAWVRDNALVAAQMRGYCLAKMDTMLSHPPESLVRAYFSLSHNETFGVGTFIDKRPVFPWKIFLLAPFSGAYRRKVVDHAMGGNWPAGFFAYYRLLWMFHLAIKMHKKGYLKLK